MSFLTDFTPPTFFATMTAESALACELTKPLSCTTPLKVSTLISADLRLGCSKIAVFTLAVTTLSSTYSPVPSDLEVDAQPRVTAVARVAARAINVLFLVIGISGWRAIMGLLPTGVGAVAHHEAQWGMTLRAPK